MLYKSEKLSFVKNLYDYFIEFIYDISFFDLDCVYLTDNIKEDALYFYGDQNKIEEINYSGVTFLPNKVLDKITVLTKIQEEDFLRSTEHLIHEFVECGGLSGKIEENSVKLGIRCNNCGKLHIILEKQTTIDNRSSQINNPSKSNQVICPYCKSTKVEKISSTSRGASIMTFGIFSKKINKQWHCNNCKSDF